MTTTAPQLALTRIVNAPRAVVYEAFTDPISSRTGGARSATRCPATRSLRRAPRRLPTVVGGLP